MRFWWVCAFAAVFLNVLLLRCPACDACGIDMSPAVVDCRGDMHVLARVGEEVGEVSGCVR